VCSGDAFAHTGAAEKLIATMLATVFAAPERDDLKQSPRMQQPLSGMRGHWKSAPSMAVARGSPCACRCVERVRLTAKDPSRKATYSLMA
jgi:hypothetical protein